MRSASGDEAVLRRLTVEPWSRFADTLLRREREALTLLASSDVPAPGLIAVDVDGSASGEPSLLMTRVGGRVDVVRCDPDYLTQMAEALVGIQAITPALWPGEYRSWAFESKLHVPPLSRDDGLYLEAFARLREPAPPYRRTFIHRDYYPANILWEDGSLSGVVDWNEACSGPADLDVAHCSSNLAGLHGVECALASREAYVAAGGELEPDDDASRYWQLMDLVAFLPEPSGAESGATGSTMTDVWRANGRADLTGDLVRRRREDLLRAILAGRHR